MNAKAITCWADESKIDLRPGGTWIIGQLIIACESEFAFLEALRDARRKARTWNKLHANRFNQRDAREWQLLQHWLSIFKTQADCCFLGFVYDENRARLRQFSTQHDYFAHQLCFGLGTKMRRSGATIATLFSTVDTIIFLMDRRAATIGGRQSDLEALYERRMTATLLRQSFRKPKDFSLRFTFANSACFDALQLCDCLTSMLRSRYLYEASLTGARPDWLQLWNREFTTPFELELKDFEFNQKFNYFRVN